MRRDLARLSAAAARVEADLRRTTQRPWICSVADDYTLYVTDGVISERVLLDADVEDEDWFAPPGASPAEIEAGRAADAAAQGAGAGADRGAHPPVHTH